MQLFSDSQFVPIATLADIDSINNDKGYLVGTTNLLLLDYSKLKADVVVDLDK